MHSFADPEWSDTRLVDEVARRIAIPRESSANSFVLHAPLELSARAAILPMVQASNRDDARRRIAAMVVEYEEFSAPAIVCAERSFDSLEAAAAYLRAAVADRDLDGADAAATYLARFARPDQLPSLLAPTVLPSLAAAAHGSIFLYLLPRVAPRGGELSFMLRPLVRELARDSALKMHWLDEREGPASWASSRVSLLEALHRVPRLGIPGSSFIFPLMHQAEQNGMARNLLDGPVATTSIGDASRVLLRTAALSMLGEPTTHAAYGWSHCLTMTQGALGMARALNSPELAIAVAATYVVGFRAALANNDLLARFEPQSDVVADEVSDIKSASVRLEASPQEAAAVMWRAPEAVLEHLVGILVSRAAAHHDAHLVKYTLACLDAAAFDREQRRLYLAAMAFLNTLWLRNPSLSF